MKQNKELYDRLADKADRIEVRDSLLAQQELKVPEIVPESQYMDEIGHIIRRDFYQKDNHSLLESYPLQDLNSYLATHVTQEDCRLKELISTDRNRLWKTSEIVAEGNQISTLFLPKSSYEKNDIIQQQNSSILDNRISDANPGRITGMSERLKKTIAKTRKTFPENAGLIRDERRTNRLRDQSGIVKRKGIPSASTRFSSHRASMTSQRGLTTYQTSIKIYHENIISPD